MSNLIPERRTNKNGVTSTKWVKPSFSKEPLSTAIPMPIASVRPYQWVDLQRDVIEVSDLLPSSSSTSRVQNMIRGNLTRIGEHDAGMLTRMKTIASEYGPAPYLLKNLIIKDGNYAATDHRIDFEQEMRTLDTALHIIPLCSRLEDQLGFDTFDAGSEGNRLIDSVVQVLKQEGVTGLDEDHTVAFAMITFIRGDFDLFATGDDDLSYAEVEDGVEYIAHHLNETEPLLPELKARKAYDSGTIELLKNTPAKSISSGLL